MHSGDFGHDAKTAIELTVQLHAAALHPEVIAVGGIGKSRVVGYGHIEGRCALRRQWASRRRHGDHRPHKQQAAEFSAHGFLMSYCTLRVTVAVCCRLPLVAVMET